MAFFSSAHHVIDVLIYQAEVIGLRLAITKNTPAGHSISLSALLVCPVCRTMSGRHPGIWRTPRDLGICRSNEPLRPGLCSVLVLRPPPSPNYKQPSMRLSREARLTPPSWHAALRGPGHSVDVSSGSLRGCFLENWFPQRRIPASAAQFMVSVPHQA